MIPYATDDSIEGQPGTALMFDKAQLAATVSDAAPGIHIDLTSGSGTHTWVVEGHEAAFKLEANPGAPDSGTIVLPPGTYTYYCDIPGHRQAGMQGTLTVTADPNAQPINTTGAGGAGGETSTTAAGG